jgi:DNA-binding response OmpR family regulator
MHAITRRKHGLEKNQVRIHEFVLDIQNRTVCFKTDPIPLTKKEFEIFNYLVLNKNRVVSRVSLTEHVWGDILEVNSDSNFVDVHVKNLRKKLGNFAETGWLETVRSVGYRVKY